MWKQLLLAITLCLLASEEIFTGELKAILLGDWGEILLNGQDRVAAAMASWAEVNNPDFIITTGDNIYPNGISSPDDPSMDTLWRNVYDNDSLVNLPWYVSVGNHDYGADGSGREWNEVEFSKLEPRWILPHLWHDFVVDLDDHSVHFVLIDTEAYRMQVNNYTDMLVWMEDTLSASTADWKFVIGHRPAYSSGDYGPANIGILTDLIPIMERNHVDAYICGHDHNLQHIRNMSGAGMDFIVEGAGGAFPYFYSAENEQLLNEMYGMELLYFKSTFGFITITTSQNEVLFDYFDQNEVLLYNFTRSHVTKMN